MDFAMPEELLMLQKLARKFIEDKLLPLERQVEEAGEFPEELRRRLRELERIRRDLEPWLDEALDRLERFVQRDLPFLEVERRARLEAVRRALDGYGVGVAEKLRRLLEALKAEVEYGAQVEVTERTVELEGEAAALAGRLAALRAERAAAYLATRSCSLKTSVRVSSASRKQRALSAPWFWLTPCAARPSPQPHVLKL